MEDTVEMASDGMIHLPSFMMISSGIQVILRLLPQQFVRLMNYAVEMGSDGTTYILSSMNIFTGVQVTLIFFLSSLRGCNVGITNGRNYEVRR
jgi:hypothetical protein